MKTKRILSIVINSIIVISTIIIVVKGFIYGASAGQVGSDIKGFAYFKPYTMDSNIFCAIGSLLVLLFNLKNINNNRKLPHYLSVLHLSGATSLCLTFLTVLLFLGPSKIIAGEDFKMLFMDDMFFFHVLNPLLAFTSFLFLNNGNKLVGKDIAISMIPTITYGIIYMLGISLFKWEDFYNFTLGGSVLAAIVSTTILFTAFYFINKIYIKIYNKRLFK